MNADLSEIFQESFSTNGEVLPDEQDLRSLDGWDSMAHMMFIMKLETAYGVELTGDDIADMQTVGQVRETLAKHGIKV